MVWPILGWFLGRPAKGQFRADRESFGNVSLDPKAGQDILEATPERRSSRDAIRSALLGIDLAERADLVDRVLVRFALYTGDLPASESNHHARPFGLFDHSLEVARAAVLELARPSFRVSEDPAANFREHPIWAYAGFILGLLHDVGKLLDVEVFCATAKDPWQPLVEPVSSYLGRHGARGPEDRVLRWKRGRGLTDHVSRGRGLVPLVLPPSALAYLGARLNALLETFVRSYDSDRKQWELGPAGRVVATVRRWDRDLSKNEDPAGPRLRLLASPEATCETGEAVEPEGPEAVPATQEQAVPALVPEESLTETAGTPIKKAPSRESYVQAELPLPTPDRGGEAEDERAAPPVEWSGGFPLENPDLARVLEPQALLFKLQRAIVNGILHRNGIRGEAFLTKTHLWLTWPDAFVVLLDWIGTPYQATYNEVILAALRRLPILAPSESGSPLHYAMLHPGAEKPRMLVRFRLQGFLAADELAPLKRWEHEIQPKAILSKAG